MMYLKWLQGSLVQRLSEVRASLSQPDGNSLASISDSRPAIVGGMDCFARLESLGLREEWQARAA